VKDLQKKRGAFHHHLPSPIALAAISKVGWLVGVEFNAPLDTV